MLWMMLTERRGTSLGWNLFLCFVPRTRHTFSSWPSPWQDWPWRPECSQRSKPLIWTDGTTSTSMSPSADHVHFILLFYISNFHQQQSRVPKCLYSPSCPLSFVFELNKADVIKLKHYSGGKMKSKSMWELHPLRGCRTMRGCKMTCGSDARREEQNLLA